ncbi:MAG: class I SAM-dependent RNA methyltransferase [Candidatus Omnitrophica bacterium]|nr:class I SAM-dependent RNA methyltransferase [Candidatus Omnitrophota bacterium]
MNPQSQPVQIEKVVFGGAGLARVYGKVCFIDDVLPGEKVDIHIVEHQKGFSRARLLQVLEPSQARIESACVVSTKCGGCQYQHMTYEEEIHIKNGQVQEAFTRAIKLSPSLIRPLEFHSDPYHYRNYVTLHSRMQKGESAPRFGYLQRDNRTVFSLDHCPIASPSLEPAFKRNWDSSSGQDRVTFSRAENGDVLTSESPRLYPVQVAGKQLWAHSQGHFKDNLRVTELLLKQIHAWTAKLQPQTFVDLYAGVGLFGLLASGNAPRVIFVEENGFNFQALKENKKFFDEEHFSSLSSQPLSRGPGILGQDQNGRFVLKEGKSEVVFPALAQFLKPEETLILMDLPSMGLDPMISRDLAKTKNLKGLICISRDLPILIRDLKILLSEGNFEIQEVVPFDMLPRTKHIETAVFLQSSERVTG